MELSDLKNLQRWFSCEIFEKNRVNPEPAFKRLVRETAKFPRDRRLRVYSYGIEARLCDALKVDFPYTSEVLKKDFAEISRQYFSKFPSVYASLDRVGKDFARFLDDSPWSKELPYISELARLEWVMAETFFIDGIKKPNRNLLQDVKPTDLERAVLLTNPSAQIFESKSNLDEFLFVSADSKDLGPFLYLAYNDGEVSLTEKLTPTQKTLWNLITQKKSLAVICDELSTLLPADEDPGLVMKSLQKWIELGLIYGITVS